MLTKEERERDLFKSIPHGSGIDCAWEIYSKRSYFKCCNSFHVMNEHGFYIGYADFSIIIPKKNPEDFKLHFHGRRSKYLNERNLLRDYLEETFAYWISEWESVKKRHEEAKIKKSVMADADSEPLENLQAAADMFDRL